MTKGAIGILGIFSVVCVTAQELSVGQPITRGIRAGEVHRYQIPARTGEFFKGSVRQDGITINVKGFFSDGSKIRSFSGPPAGTKVDTGSSVDIAVSSGSPTPSPTPTATASSVKVPNVNGMDVGTATSTLSAAGFLVTVKEKFSAQPAGTVIKMFPEADTMAPDGSTVFIVVAK